MADKNIIANRNQLYLQSNRADALDDNIAPQARVGKDNDKECKEEVGKPRFGQRAMPDEAFFERLIENQKVRRQPLWAVAPEEDGEGSVLQRVLLNGAEGKAAFKQVMEGIVADDRHRHVRPLHIPEDVLGRLHQGIAIDPGACVDMLKKSQ